MDRRSFLKVCAALPVFAGMPLAALADTTSDKGVDTLPHTMNAGLVVSAQYAASVPTLITVSEGNRPIMFLPVHLSGVPTEQAVFGSAVSLPWVGNIDDLHIACPVPSVLRLTVIYDGKGQLSTLTSLIESTKRILYFST